MTHADRMPTYLTGHEWTNPDLIDDVVGSEGSDYQWPVRSAAEAGIAVRVD